MSTLSGMTISAASVQPVDGPLLANDMVFEITDLPEIGEPERIIKPPSRRAVSTAMAMP